jgi:hypothetical protein
MHRSRAGDPVLITDARVSSKVEFDRRRKRYALMMGTRGLCVLGAALTYQVSIFLSLALIVGGAVLPWCAVLIANDGPVKKRPAPRAPVVAPLDRTLTAGPDGRTIEG